MQQVRQSVPALPKFVDSPQVRVRLSSEVQLPPVPLQGQAEGLP